MVAVLGETCWQMFGSVRRSADLTEYYRRDIVSDHIGAVRAHLSRGSCLSLTQRTRRFLWNTEAVPFHFIIHDKSLDSKPSHRVFGVFDVSYCYALFIWFSLTCCGKVYVKCWVCYAISLRSDGKNGFLKVMHTEILCFCLFFAVSCVTIIPVPRHDLIWLLAFLRNRFWWKDNSDGQVMELKANSIQLRIQRFSHCASFNIVCGLHPGNMLSEYNWNTVYSLNRDIFEAPPPLPFLNISLFFYLLKTKAPCVVVLF